MERTVERNKRLRRLSMGIMGIGLVSLIAAGVLLALTVSGNLGDDGNSGPGTSVDIGDISFALTPQATPTAVLPPPSDAPIARLSIPRFGVDAPVIVLGVDGNNVMQSPDGPTEVAWYDFSSRPGFGGNAVFSGHVDYINYGPAVFWNLKDLAQGDTIEVHLQDGTVLTYAVDSRNSVSASPTEEELRGIVGPAETDVVTLITCGGTFNFSTHQYDQRVIVRATRVVQAVSGSAQGP